MWGAFTTAMILLAVACRAGLGQDGEASPAIAFETLLETTHSGLDERLREVVRDEGRWSELWAQIHRGDRPQPPLPPADFARHMLIAVATGTRSSGGFTIAVQGVTLGEDGLEVEVLESCPPAGAMTSSVLTRPVEIVRLHKTTLSPRFRDVKSPSCK